MHAVQTLILAAPLSLSLLVASGCGAAAPPNSSAGPAETFQPREEKGQADAKPTGDSAPDDAGEGGVDAVRADKNKGDSREKTSRGLEGDASASPAPPPPGGPQQAAVAAAAGSPLSSGRLSQKDIGEILGKNSALFNDCYTIGASGGQSFTGTVTIKATLGPGGNVADAQVTKSTARNQKVDTCVVQAFKKIKFPAPQDGATSVITFPMEFNGVEQVR